MDEYFDKNVLTNIPYFIVEYCLKPRNESFRPDCHCTNECPSMYLLFSSTLEEMQAEESESGKQKRSSFNESESNPQGTFSSDFQCFSPYFRNY